MNSLSDIKNISAANEDFFIRIRRELHAAPELANQEFKTADKICETLEDIGISYTKNFSGTGVVAIIQGCNNNQKTIGFRADMDALAIQEENNVDYKSANNGIMHACGHDAHVATLLFAAKILHNLKDRFSGNIKLIFQPSEEEYEGGAPFMIKDGVLDNPKIDCMFGFHVDTDIPAGTIGLKNGVMTASTDELHLHITGKGGHAAYPENYVNPAAIAAHIFCELENMSKTMAPADFPSVLTFGKINANGKVNVIADTAVMEGTLRTFDSKWRQTAHQQIYNITQSVAELFHGKCNTIIKQGYPSIVNDTKLTQNVKRYITNLLGENHCIEVPLRMGADDFAYYAEKIPSCFFRLGAALDENNYGLHSSRFNINEKCLSVGAQTIAWIAINELSNLQ